MITRQTAKALPQCGGSASSSLNSFSQYKCSVRTKKRRQINLRHNHNLDTNLFESLLETSWSRTPEEKRSSCIYLDSLWFSLYKEESSRTKVLRWIEKKQILKKQHIFVPIVCWSHWSLLILCNFDEKRQARARKPFMLLLDSLHKTDPKRLEPAIRRFVLDIYKTEGREENGKFVSEIPLLIPKVPQQKGGEECGNFVLYFIFLFVSNAPNTQEECLCFLNEDWFKHEELENFYMEIHSSLQIGKGKANTHKIVATYGRNKYEIDNVDPNTYNFIDLKKEISKVIRTTSSVNNTAGLRYMVPGHDKRYALTSDQEMIEMFNAYKGIREINIIMTDEDDFADYSLHEEKSVDSAQDCHELFPQRPTYVEDEIDDYWDICIDDMDEGISPKKESKWLKSQSIVSSFYEHHPNKKIELKISMMFVDVNTFRQVLREFCIQEGFNIRRVKNEKSKVTARCKYDSCPWKIHASKIHKEKAFVIMSYQPNHTCVRLSSFEANSAWILSKLQEDLRVNPNMTYKAMRHELQNRYNINPSINQLYRVKRKVKFLSSLPKSMP